MKVVWICHFSDNKVRNQLRFSNNLIIRLILRLLGKPPKQIVDFAAWITNGINEIEKTDNVELHVISPHHEMRYSLQKFTINGIHYHFFKPEGDALLKKVKKFLVKKQSVNFYKNRRTVKKLIDKINPDVIHMFGAENPYYSITALDIDVNKYPFLVSLQTLMSDKEFQMKVNMDQQVYNFRSNIEKQVLKHANYLGSTVPKYRKLVWQNINPNAIFTNTTLAVAENIKPTEIEKEYDFVYFAASIEKAADVAIEAFAIACKSNPSLKLNIVGGSSKYYYDNLLTRIEELGIRNNIKFSGKLPTHKDVITQIQKSKYALLPLKVDITSGTIREAMFLRIPVVTTETPGTPALNEKRESVLISKQNDFADIAANMIKLVDDDNFAHKLIDNALTTVNEKWNNKKIIRDILKAYQAIINHQNHNEPIPVEIGVTNSGTTLN